MTNDQMMRDALTNHTRKPVGKRTVIIGAVIAAVVLTGGGIGTKALIDYRTAIEASQEAAADYYEAADQRVAEAGAAALAAQEAAETAQAATDSLVAAEEAAAAQAAADEAARVAAEAAAAANNNSSGGGTAPSNGKCPAGTAPGQIDSDGTESLCAPTGPGGATCAEYDGPTCTSWLKP